MPEVTQAAEQVISHGPWMTLSVSLVCATVAFIFIGLRHYLNRKENGHGHKNHSLEVMNKRIDRLHEKLDRVTIDVSENAKKLAFICGKLNHKGGF